MPTETKGALRTGRQRASHEHVLCDVPSAIKLLSCLMTIYCCSKCLMGEREDFLVFPGGGREPGETEEECVEREVREETHLAVAVARFLFEVPDVPEGNYERLRTYLCTIQEGTAHPGTEPEIDDVHPIIREIGWFDLWQPETWIRCCRKTR